MAKSAEDKIVDQLKALVGNMKLIYTQLVYLEDAIEGLPYRIEKAKSDSVMRECLIDKKSFKDGPRRAIFHGWFCLKSVNIEQILGIVEYEDGSVEQVKPSSIIFADHEAFFIEDGEKKINRLTDPDVRLETDMNVDTSQLWKKISIPDIYNKLAEYEDLGVEPEDIKVYLKNHK